jgi:WD repeat-containing protein 61
MVAAAAAHPAGALTAAVSLDSFIRVFGIDTGAFVATLEVPLSEVCGVQFHPKVSARLLPP